MSWVADTFAEQELFDSGVEKLWDQMRDAIGEAALTFNGLFEPGDVISHGDCTANGKYCVRVHRSLNESTVEVYLDRKVRTLCIAVPSKSSGKQRKNICGYRIEPGRKHLEFFDQNGSLTTDQVCKLALYDLLFNPPPITKRQ